VLARAWTSLEAMQGLRMKIEEEKKWMNAKRNGRREILVGLSL